MGKTITEWELVIKSLSLAQKQKVVSSIDFLMSIPEIKKEYEWTGLPVLEGIARFMLKESQQQNSVLGGSDE